MLRVTREAGDPQVTGRVYILMTVNGEAEPRLQRVGWGSIQPFFGLDVEEGEGVDPVVFDGNVAGYPYEHLPDVPSGRYVVQAVMDVYDRYDRSDDHQVWLPRVEWEGRVFTKTPGNLYSKAQWVDVENGTDP